MVVGWVSLSVNPSETRPDKSSRAADDTKFLRSFINHFVTEANINVGFTVFLVRGRDVLPEHNTSLLYLAITDGC